MLYVTDRATLRRATPHDAAAIRDLSRAAYAKWVQLIGREPWPMVADYDAAVRNHVIDLLDIDTALVALVEVILRPDHLLIENIAVAPAFQGLGHGRRLMDHAEHYAAACGFGEVRLYTNQLFAANIDLYRRLGYRIAREETITIGVIVHMRKTI